MPSGDNTAEQDKVRELQVKLYLAAKRSPGRRFHALWDRIHRRDVLERAWQVVRENRGSAGVDRITITQIEERGVALIGRVRGRVDIPRQNTHAHRDRDEAVLRRGAIPCIQLRDRQVEVEHRAVEHAFVPTQVDRVDEDVMRQRDGLDHSSG